MMRNLWRNAWRKMAVVAVAGALAGTTANYVYSQDTSPNALLQRLERLEQQNKELQQKLQNVSSPVNTDGGLDAKAVESIVGNYLAAQAKKDEAKKNEPVAVGSDLNFKVTWKDGVTFATPNNDFKFHVGGRVQFDMGRFDEDTATMPRYDDAAGFRRMRLRADGAMWEVFEWLVEVDFANSGGTGATATFTDVYIDFTQLPVVGNFRAGRFFEPFSLEQLTSSRLLNHIERSAPHQAFVPARNLGLMFHRAVGEQQRGTIATGIFRDDTGDPQDPGKGNGGFGKYEGEYAWTSRATYLPVWEHDGRCLVHVGAAYSWRNHFGNGPADALNRSRNQAQAETRLGTPAVLDTGGIPDLESISLGGFELAGQYGPVNLMSEVYLNQVNRENGLASPFFWGAYAQVGYFLTGEHRPYKKTAAAFDRVRPLENFFLVKGEHGVQRGMGAWEVVARVSYLDLRDDGFVVLPNAARAGGTGLMRNYMVGVNWYLNPNMKWQFNWVRSNRDSDGGPAFDGNVDVWQARLAIDF